jgi:hypothetical protein
MNVKAEKNMTSPIIAAKGIGVIVRYFSMPTPQRNRSEAKVTGLKLVSVAYTWLAS